MNSIEPYFSSLMMVVLFSTTIFFMHRRNPIKHLIGVIAASAVLTVLLIIAITIGMFLIGWGDAISETPAIFFYIIYYLIPIIAPIFIRYFFGGFSVKRND
jgi:drug/metabolite transporter (DMT)-like permease